MIAFLLLFVVLGSVIFHLLSPWWWTPIASNWGGIDATVQLTFLLTGTVFVLVLLFMIYCIVKYRYREDRRGEYQPEDKKLEMRLTVLTTIGVIALLAPGLMVWNDYVNPPEDAIPIEVMGQQWSWSFRLTGEDGILGTTDARNISPENPFGLNPKDPNGQDDILLEGDDLHLLVDKPVKVLLRSIDVLHDFYVPQFRAKMDLVPGMITYYWFTPTREGEFEILCAELCGVGHHVMRGLVVVDNESSYQEWISEQSTFKEFQNAAKSDSNDVYVKN
ncbi:MAG TPA: cytochrome c oxidase subunit II [Flavobacteriales bacterium]|jgi:cytochrome c oxidase subunit 2|nr:cytochrome c oxidase subunit II [Flavobacteriales bacterium]